MSLLWQRSPCRLHRGQVIVQCQPVTHSLHSQWKLCAVTRLIIVITLCLSAARLFLRDSLSGLAKVYYSAFLCSRAGVGRGLSIINISPEVPVPLLFFQEVWMPHAYILLLLLLPSSLLQRSQEKLTDEVLHHEPG